jgi:hypothetical protein
MDIQWRRVLRDVGIVVLFSLLGGIVVGVAGTDPSRMAVAVGASNLLFGIVAFTIVGCLAPADRFRHLAIVATVSWLVAAINVVLFGVPVRAWMAGLLIVFVTALIGGGISLLIVKSSESRLDVESGGKER